MQVQSIKKLILADYRQPRQIELGRCENFSTFFRYFFALALKIFFSAIKPICYDTLTPITLLNQINLRHFFNFFQAGTTTPNQSHSAMFLQFIRHYSTAKTIQSNAGHISVFVMNYYKNLSVKLNFFYSFSVSKISLHNIFF